MFSPDSSAEWYSQSERCFSCCRAECWCGRCSGLCWCSQSCSSPSSSCRLYWSVCLFTYLPISITASFSWIWKPWKDCPPLSAVMDIRVMASLPCFYHFVIYGSSPCTHWRLMCLSFLCNWQVLKRFSDCPHHHHQLEHHHDYHCCNHHDHEHHLHCTITVLSIISTIKTSLLYHIGSPEVRISH